MTHAVKNNTTYEAIAPLDLIGLARVVWYGKWVIAVAVIVATLLGAAYAFRMTQPRYAATAVLQTDPQAVHLRDLSDHWPAPATDTVSLNTQVTLLTSDLILTDVIAQLALADDPEFNRYLSKASPFSIGALRARIRSALSGTADPVADDAAIAAKTVLNLRAALSVVQPNDTYIFEISARSSDAQMAARIANAVAAAYIARQITAKDAATATDIAWLNGQVAALRTQLEAQERAVSNQLAQAQMPDEDALDTLSNAVLDLDAEHAATTADLAGYATANTSARQAAMTAQLEDKLADITRTRAQMQSALASQSEGLVTLHQMQREAEATRDLYQTFLARLQETKVQQGLSFPDSQVIAPATSGRFVGQRRLLLVQASAVLGGLLGLALVAVQHMGRTGIYHPVQLRQAIGTPVLGTLPAHAMRNRRTLLRFLRGPKQAATLRHMRNGLRNDSLPQFTVVSSAVGSEGETALATTLAAAFCAQWRCLLIDASGTQQRLIATPPTPTKDPALGFDVLAMPSAEPLLDADYLQHLKADYAHIIVIASPVFGCPETRHLLAKADAAVLAVSWANTPLVVVQEAMDTMKELHDGALAAVLTRTHKRRMQRLGRIMVPQHAGLPTYAG